jgi:hypothetical protein
MLPDWLTGLWEGFWQIIYDLVSQVFNLDKTFAIWVEVVKAFEDAFDGDTWYEIGWNIIEGIFLGIVGILSFPIEVVANFFETLWNNICKVFGIHSPAEKMKPLGGNILLGILQGFKDKFSDWWAAIVEWGKGTVGQFGVWARSIWYAIQKPFVSVKTWFVDKFQEAWTGIKNVFTSFGTFFGDLWDGIKTGFGDALSKLKDIAKAPLNAIISLMNGMLRGLTAGINALIDAVNSIYFEFPDWVPGLGGRYLGFNIGRMTAPVIPQLATGTVIPPNSEFLALLGDQKKGVNIEAPLDTIVDAFKKVQGDSKSSSNSMLHVTIKLPNGKVLFDSVVQAENENYKSTGQAAFVH